MKIPENILYTKDHEWLKINENNCRIGITDFAQGELGDIIFMELPSIGSQVSKGDSIGTIEAVKTVADVYTPVDGSVLKINDSLEDKPELINEDPYDKGWIAEIEITEKIDKDMCLTKDEYLDFIGR